MEAFLDGSSPLHWLVVLVLFVSGALTTWMGVRDGFVRGVVRTNSGPLTGGKARAAGVLYVAFGLAGVVGAVIFVLRAR
ncbi:MAG TPA: hypothetical protein PLL32_02420 [Anaeromyxobacteraceae bacterium]|nr:hypothetical protein [Anaeromyxobacteraceae bacterium]